MTNNVYLTIEEADKAASEAQWQSPAFDRHRDVTENVFKSRMDTCQSCDQISQQNVCISCGCFLPLTSRLAKSECPLRKWDFIVVERITPIEELVDPPPASDVVPS